MIISGKVHVLGDNVDTDGMIPGRFLALSDPKEIATHVFEEIDPGFVKRVQPGDVIVAGKNFGQGSGREQAPLGLIGLGVRCIIATSFARTFFRMAVDLGLHTVECPEAYRVSKEGDLAHVDTKMGLVRIGTQEFRTTPLPDFIQEIVDGGGIVPWIKCETTRRATAARA